MIPALKIPIGDWAADAVSWIVANASGPFSALRQLFVLAEDYPELKAATNFLELQRQLAVIEEDIAFSRRYHNAVVEDFNTRVETFPTMLVARPFGFGRRPFFEIEGGQRAAPRVAFDTPTTDPL